MTRQTRFALIAASLFLVLFVIEQWRSTDPFSILDLAADMLEVALLAGAVALTAFTAAAPRKNVNGETSILPNRMGTNCGIRPTFESINTSTGSRRSADGVQSR